MSEDTIAAVATPPGEGAVAIVRLSGPRAVAIAAKLSGSGSRFESAPSHTVHHAWLRDGNGRPLDESLVIVMRAPRTYTGEDLVEIGVHGGSILARRVLRAALEAGARLADRGEFTRRAFLAGRIDLAQAEAVVDLVRARTERGADAALRALAGGVATRTLAVEEKLFDLVARLEVNLDFVDDVAPASREEISAALASCVEDLQRLLGAAASGRKLRDGATVVLVGRPNVGKSSLFNALVQDERAIVAETPGTTRDWLEAWIDIGGVPVRLVDTAGWREATEAIEAEGVRRARRLEESADLRLVVLDESEPLRAEDEDILATVRSGERTHIVVRNKHDAASAEARTAFDSGSMKGESRGVVMTSARTGEGIERLRDEISRVVAQLPQFGEGEEILASERNEDALRRAEESARLAADAWARGATEELVAGELRAAAQAIGEITGRSVGEEVLDRIFAQFCIGK